MAQHKAAVKAAMPDVEAVVNKHSLSIVNGCIKRLYEKAKLMKKAEALRKQIKQIEERL